MGNVLLTHHNTCCGSIMHIYLALDDEDTLDQSFNIVIITGVDQQ